MYVCMYVWMCLYIFLSLIWCCFLPSLHIGVVTMKRDYKVCWKLFVCFTYLFQLLTLIRRIVVCRNISIRKYKRLIVRKILPPLNVLMNKIENFSFVILTLVVAVYTVWQLIIVEYTWQSFICSFEFHER